MLDSHLKTVYSIEETYKKALTNNFVEVEEVYGRHCFWCPRKPFCDAYAEQVKDTSLTKYLDDISGAPS